MADPSLIDRIGIGVLGAAIAAGAMLLAKLIRPRRAASEERSDVAEQATSLATVLIARMDQMQAGMAVMQTHIERLETSLEECETHRRACEEEVDELKRRVRRLESDRPPVLFPDAEVGL